jgi:hypothetical protein
MSGYGEFHNQQYAFPAALAHPDQGLRSAKRIYSKLDQMIARLDANCGPAFWAMTPSGTVS